MFGSKIEEAAFAHAAAQSPFESCGVVIDGEYVPCENSHLDPENHFQIKKTHWIALSKKGKIQAVIHSHTGTHGPFPSAHDMEAQQNTGLPWAVVTIAPKKKITWFGDQVLDVPLVGREFIPGVQDCYSIIRGYYWQERGVKLKEFPRDAEWWMDGKNLFRDGFQEAGFYAIPKEQLQEGDVMLMQIRSKTPNHGAVILKGGLMLHHVNNQLSRREPFCRWLPYATHWLRFGNA